ncbi:MAG: hypothetical protein JO112_20600 [Planctomycetes bacterium]|nr:hypothetical protein [Planctomycetota bacterium]
MKKNLIVVRAGDDSLHPGWLADRPGKDFDVLVSYFGATEGKWRDQADHYQAEPGPKWPSLNRLCQEQWPLLRQYDRVAFPDDDLAGTTQGWNDIFRLCEDYRLDLAQPAVAGPGSHEITQPRPGLVLRFTNFVEVQCPVFRTAALDEVRWTFAESAAGWGLDMMWPILLPHPWYTLAILDQAFLVHTRPIQTGSLYALLLRQGINPHEEMAKLVARFELPPLQFVEYGRVPLPSEGPAQPPG